MRRNTAIRTSEKRKGVATVEFAVLLPFLVFLFVLALDYARIFYYSMTLEIAARNGAYYASDYPGIYIYSSINQAANSDTTNLSPIPTITTRYDSSYNGSFGSTTPILDSNNLQTGYVRVTATWTFHSITEFPLLPATVNLDRHVIMRMAPIIP